MEKVTEIVKEVYKNKEAIKEVNAAIIAKIYTDQSILLKDMIYPNEGLLPASKSFKALTTKLNVQQGTFSNEFWALVSKKNDSDFSTFLAGIKPGKTEALKQDQKRGQNVKANKLLQEQYQSVDGDVSLYYPYAEQYISPFDNSGNYSPSTSVMTATAEADEGYGWQPVYDNNGNMGYTQVVINDDYAYANPTLIIGINGIEPVDYSIPAILTFPPGPPVQAPGLPREVKQVYVGDVRVNGHQYDHFVSFTGNGGGLEIRFTRADGYLKQIDGQVQAADVFVINGNPYISRWHIKNKKWVDFTATWDGDWEPANLEQNLAIYEDDNAATSTLSLSIGTTVSVGGQKQTGTVGGTLTYKSLDEIIRQNNHKYASFFPLNRGAGGGTTYNGWLVYDENGGVSFTMPDKTLIP
ncbi:MAG: hypothetical protein V5804_02625 [Mucilaginibacter sp.]|uniref:hypothetical protein n=1 Tax=Mucilaginibacter sp. TaxID=1882438 RepID=UPI0034E4ECB0